MTLDIRMFSKIGPQCVLIMVFLCSLSKACESVIRIQNSQRKVAKNRKSRKERRLLNQPQLRSQSVVNASHCVSLLQRVAIQAVSRPIGHLAVDHRSSPARCFGFEELLRFGDCAFNFVVGSLKDLDRGSSLIRNASPLAGEAEVSSEQSI